MTQSIRRNANIRHDEAGLLRTLVRIEMEKPTTEGGRAIKIIYGIQSGNVIEREMEKPTTEGNYLISAHAEAVFIARCRILDELLRC